MTKRIDALDILKALAIFLVVLGHVLQHCLSSEFQDEPVYRFIYSFHMPLFMILSGLFSRSSLKLDLSNLIIKKGKELILPCISMGGVIYVLMVASHYLSTKEIEFSVLGLLTYLLEDYWFLKSLFLCYVIMWLCIRSKHQWLCVFVALVAVQFLHNFSMPIMFPCFVVGYILKNLIDKPAFINCNIVFLITFLLFLIYPFFMNTDFFLAREYELRLLEDGAILGNAELILFRLYKLILGISGSLFIILFARKYLWNVTEKNSKMVSYTCNVGRNSLGIYLIHVLLVSYIMGKFIKFDFINPILFNTLIAPMISLLVVMVCMVMITVISKNRITRVAFLGR